MSDETQAPEEQQQQEEWPEDGAPQLPPMPAQVWTNEIGRLFGRYNNQIMQLSGQKAELEYSIGQVADVILRLCPELIAVKPDGNPESVCDCAVRLITEYVALTKGDTSGQGTVQEVAGSQAGDPGQGTSGDGAADPGLGSEGQPG